MDVEITIPAQSVTIPEQDVPVTVSVPSQSVTVSSETVTASIPAAQIVYQNSWLGQTSGFSENIYTIPSNGQYRINIGVFALIISGNAGVSATISYPVPSTPPISWNYILASAGGSMPNIPEGSSGAIGCFAGITGQQVPIKVVVSGGTIDHYDLYVTIEQLQ